MQKTRLKIAQIYSYSAAILSIIALSFGLFILFQQPFKIDNDIKGLSVAMVGFLFCGLFLITQKWIDKH
jgi:hypothetical protein